MKDKVLDSRTLVSRRLRPDEWGTICALPWTEANQRAIGKLFSRDGNGLADEVLDGRIATATRINRFFAAQELPYRLKRYWLPEEQWPARAKKTVERQGVRIVTLVKKA